MVPSVRTYGSPPYRAALLHGGPGAPGYMAPVARELSHQFGVLEPLQSAMSLDGQVVELSEQLRTHTDQPIALVGSSWGAVLALFLAARQPSQVSRLILIGSAVFDAASSASITPRRLKRLTPKQRQRHDELVCLMETASPDSRDSLMSEWGSLLSDADMYDPITRGLEVLEVQYELHTRVWNDFVARRDEPGRLASELDNITAPTVLIHGEYDPHPISGIQPFLESCLDSPVCHVLPNCGHYPWVERRAAGDFYRLLRDYLRAVP